MCYNDRKIRSRRPLYYKAEKYNVRLKPVVASVSSFFSFQTNHFHKTVNVGSISYSLICFTIVTVYDWKLARPSMLADRRILLSVL